MSFSFCFFTVQIQLLLLFNCTLLQLPSLHYYSNTTPVTVQPPCWRTGSFTMGIQIQHLLLFNMFKVFMGKFIPIQIQHLLLFNISAEVRLFRINYIQIQYLLLFNYSMELEESIQCNSNTTLVTVQLKWQIPP